MHLKRKAVATIFIILLFIIAFFSLPRFTGLTDIPNSITIWEGGRYETSYIFPFSMSVVSDTDENIIKVNNAEISKDTPLVVKNKFFIDSIKLGKVNLNLKIFGFIPFKNITVDVKPEMTVVPGGHSIGLKLKSEGVIVIKYSDIVLGDGKKVNPAKDAGLKIGDLIISINDITVTNLDHASEIINNNHDKSLKFTIKNDGHFSDIIIKPVYCSEEDAYRIGVWIRDTAAGVGTLTFFEPMSKKFGALGHVIADTDTGQSISISKGEILSANIVAIQKGEENAPGEKRGAFDLQSEIRGTLEKNSSFGVFGSIDTKMSNPYYKDTIPVALKTEVEVGEAEILTVLEGQTIERFKVRIDKIFMQSTPDTKSMVIKITDPDLIGRTGGIIQGMSGSPIIQNGKLVGAITHVFTNNPKMGYGVFAEWMLNETGLSFKSSIEK